MASDQAQRDVFAFLSAHFATREPFTIEELEGVAPWRGATLRTYLTRHWKPFLTHLADGRFTVNQAFRRFATWERFRPLLTQMRRAASDYESLTFDIVRIYEFYMPLSNEAYLRSTLDSLFYSDTIIHRLRAVGLPALEERFHRRPGEDDAEYLDRTCDWLDEHFIGYSIYHVHGRYRAGDLRARADVGRVGGRYLVDETTAVVRFMFPCVDADEAALVAYFFDELFVQAVVEVVSGEDEIWMAETGYQTRLHIWRVVT